jgi:hypothetical protein
MQNDIRKPQERGERRRGSFDTFLYPTISMLFSSYKSGDDAWGYNAFNGFLAESGSYDSVASTFKT